MTKSKHEHAVTRPTDHEQVSQASDSGGCGVREIGGRKDGLEPTRFGDWEKNGRCIDF